jgi:hypothetical protein
MVIKTMDININVWNLMLGYETWISELKDGGWEVVFVSFLFHPLRCSGPRVVRAMEEEVERFYRTLLPRVVRHPRRPINQDKLPRLIGCPDGPVPRRHAVHRVAELRPNNGLHYHALLAIPGETWLKRPFAAHFEENRALYMGTEKRIAQIHLLPISDPRGGVVPYGLKHVRRGTFTTDDILVLPKSRAELGLTSPPTSDGTR